LIWLHEKVFRHKVRRKDFSAFWAHGGQIPKRTLYTCSCKKSWVRREKVPR
jgi:uncharacterized membrane protein YsdA (DUF1294 family)